MPFKGSAHNRTTPGLLAPLLLVATVALALTGTPATAQDEDPSIPGLLVGRFVSCLALQPLV